MGRERSYQAGMVGRAYRGDRLSYETLSDDGSEQVQRLDGVLGGDSMSSGDRHGHARMVHLPGARRCTKPLTCKKAFNPFTNPRGLTTSPLQALRGLKFTSSHRGRTGMA